MLYYIEKIVLFIVLVFLLYKVDAITARNQEIESWLLLLTNVVTSTGDYDK